MKEEISIWKDDDKAIIMSFIGQQGPRLSSAQITDYVMKHVERKSEQSIRRKIRRWAENEYLLHDDDINGNYIYYLNPDFEFIFEGEDLKPLNDPGKEATPAQTEHTSVLKEAIRTWIDNLAEPNTDYPIIGESQGSSVIAACESHILFPDLVNHLPVLGTDVCSQWDEYKKELLQLDELKQSLVTSLRVRILNCFEGLDIHFVYDDSEYGLGDYECCLNPAILYDVVIRLESRDKGYDYHMQFLSWLENNAPVVEEGDHLLWGEVITYLRVPKKDRALLEAGVTKFLAFFKNIPDSEFLGRAEEIVTKVDHLKSERDRILRKLEQAMIYASFPGGCKYLQ